MELYVRSDSVVSRIIAGETLIVPVSKGVGDLASIYSLNSVAGTIWEAVSEPASQDDIVDRIAQEFDGDRQQIHCDVRAFLVEMESAGLVKMVGTATQV
jgi:hypothetical protein